MVSFNSPIILTFDIFKDTVCLIIDDRKDSDNRFIFIFNVNLMLYFSMRSFNNNHIFSGEHCHNPSGNYHSNFKPLQSTT